MFLKFISYIHKKPRHVRSLIALGTSVGLTLIIGGFWLVSYTQYVNEKMNSESAISFSSIYKKIKETATQPKDEVQTASVSNVVPVQESTSTDETATSSEDESVKATTSSEDLIQ